MKISESETITAILNEKNELIAVTHKNGHITTYICKAVNMTEHTKLLTALASKSETV